MQRIHNWELVLDNEFIEADGKSFEWGSRDCCMWACNVALKMTGVDLAADLRGSYTSGEEAASQMLTYCNGGVEALALKVASKLKIQEIPPLRASRGDIVLVETEGNGGAAHQVEWETNGTVQSLAVVGLDARYAATFVGEGFICNISQDCWKRGWRI